MVSLIPFENVTSNSGLSNLGSMTSEGIETNSMESKPIQKNEDSKNVTKLQWHQMQI